MTAERSNTPLDRGTDAAGQGLAGRRGLLKAAAALAVFPVVGCSGAEATDSGGPAPAGPSVGGKSVMVVPSADRQRSPEVEGPELGTDETIALADYRGKIIVLNVWGSWCAPCRKEAPDLEAAWQRTKPGAQFIGINTRDASQDQALAFVRAFDISYPHIYDPAGSLIAQFNSYLPMSAIPSSLVIDSQFKIAARIIGTISENSLVDIIDDVAGSR